MESCSFAIKDERWLTDKWLRAWIAIDTYYLQDLSVAGLCCVVCAIDPMSYLGICVIVKGPESP